MLSIPSPSADDDEKEYFIQKFPWGKPIFEAAFSGNAEAEYVMSLYYRDVVYIANYPLSEK